MICRVLGIASLAVVCGAGPAWAAAPVVTSLNPSGGQRGTEVSVTLQGNVGATTPEVWSDRPGLEFVRPEQPGPMTVKVAADAAVGLYWLRFFNVEGSAALRPFYVGHLPEVLEVEPNDSIRKPQVLPATRVVVNGVLAKGEDADVYAIPLQAGQTVVASVASFLDLGSPMDGVLQILSPAGHVLEQNEDDQGFDPRITFTAPAEGTYFARVFAFPAMPDSTIRLAGGPDYVYRLTVSTGPFADHAWPPAALVGQPASLSLVSAAGTPFPERLELPSFPLGRQRTWSTAADAAVTFVGTSGPVVEEATPADGSAQVLPSVPVAVAGQIARLGEQDRYRIALTKDRPLWLELHSRSLGAPLDPVLRILDAAGKVLKEADDLNGEQPDPQTDFVVPADGEYAFQVTERYGFSGPRDVYVLTIADLAPTARLFVAADSFVVASDKPLEIPVSVERTGGFDDEITISAVELPEGVVCEPVVAKPKEPPAKEKGRRRGRAGANAAETVTLKLTSTSKMAFRGPLKLVGKVTGEEPLDLVVNVTVKTPEQRIPHAWLTVVPAKE